MTEKPMTDEELKELHQAFKEMRDLDIDDFGRRLTPTIDWLEHKFPELKSSNQTQTPSTKAIEK